MANYRISEETKADLNRIYQRGVREYGEALGHECAGGTGRPGGLGGSLSRDVQ